jgi:homoserine dehydrogenase
MTHVNLARVGFGNVGRALAVLLMQKRAELEQKYGLTYRVTGIATGRHGAAINPDGLDLTRALELVRDGQSLHSLSTLPAPADGLAFVRAVPADVMFENSPVNRDSGQPAVDHIRAALERGMHAITANKGPVAHAYRELSDLASARGRRFLYESTVMDGAPVFSTFRGPLPAANILRLRGILNSTTNLILEMMESGQSFDEAVRHCISVGLAETDPSADVDGWDSSIKVAILVTVLMGVKITPQEVDRTGIRAVTAEMVAEALRAGERWKLVCSAEREGDAVRARVAPQRVPAADHLYSIRGSGSGVEFDLDIQPGLGIYKDDSGPETTAYGLMADMINAVRGM